MKELVKIYKDRGTEFIEDLFNEYVVITEKLSGSSFSFQKEGYNLYFYKGDNRKPINLIDRTLMVYYEPAISYISSLSPDVFEGVPDNWRFGFQYFVHNAPGVITYDKLPKNNLVLTHILVKDEKGKNVKVIEDPRVIKDWAHRLNVTPMQPIFQGHLDERQKKKLLNFIEVPVEDQMELFGTTSFVAYIIKCLNPTINSTTLHTDLSKPIDSIIFKFYKPGSTQTFSAKMVDPYARSLMKEKKPIDLRRAPADINEIVLLDILAFLEERGLKKHEVLSHSPEEKYLELISALFNDYVEKRGDDLQKLDFQKADFAKGPEFDVNLDLIRNEKTKKFIGGSEALKDLFKVMLGSLRKKRNPEKEGALFTKSIIVDFNKMVDKIKDITKEEGDGKFKTFEDYLTLKNMNEELYIKDDLLDMIFEEQVLNYADFVNIKKFNINEALRVPHKNQGKRKVNMFAGRFQPFTTGHIKVLQDLHKQNGLPVMVMIVRGSKRDPKRTPFDEDTQQRMVAALQSQYPFIEGSVVVPNGAIDTMFSSLRPTYEPVLWGYGTDRKKSYDGQIQHDSYRAQLGVLPEFQGHEIKRGDEDVSASKVRNAIERDDRKGYEKLVPRSLHDFYDELQNIMVPIEEALLSEEDRKAGDVWKTGTGFRGQNAKGDRKTFKSKEQTQQWMETDKEEKEEEKEEKTSEEIEALNKATEGIKGHTGKKISEKSVNRDIKGEVENIKAKLKDLNPEQQKHAQDLIDGMESFSDAKTPKEKEEAIKNLVDKGLIKRNEPGTSTVKIYIDPKTGLDYKEFGQNTALHQSITAYDQKARNDGEELIPTQKKSTMGGKKMNPSGIFKDKDGTPMVDAVDIKKTDGGVNIGGVDYEKNPDPEKDPEFNKKLISHFTKDGKLDKEAYDSAVTAIHRNNEIIDEVEKVLVEGGRLDVVDPLPGTQPTTPENAKKVGNAAINQTADKIEQELKAAGNDPLTKDQKEIVDRMKNLEKLDGEEFEKELLEVAALVAANPATDAGFADMCETFSYISALKEGRAAYLPTAGNFPLGDLVSMSNAKISDEDFDDPEAMSNKIKLMQISVENRSIKAKGGAASSSAKKNELTTFKEAKNKETGKPIPGEEVKQDMQDINDKAYFAVWDSDDPEDIKNEQTKLNGLAKKYGVDTTSDSYKKDKEDSVKTALEKVAKDRAKDSKKYPPLSKKEEALLRAKLEAYYDMGKIYEKGYNDNYDTQLYTNENWDYDKKTGKVTRSQTDGICEVSDVKFAFNVGFGKSGRPANRVPTRFHNVDKCKEEKEA